MKNHNEDIKHKKVGEQSWEYKYTWLHKKQSRPIQNLTGQSHAQESTPEYRSKEKRSVFCRNYIPITIIASFTAPKTESRTKSQPKDN